MRKSILKLYLPIFFLLCGEALFAQGEANVWYFGGNAGLDFNSDPPVALTNGALNTFEGCSSISNKNGQLLFYSDGITVWNRNHVAMPNGNAALLGNPSSTQSAIIVPKPGTYNMLTRAYDNYYIVTVDVFNGNSGVRFSEINMTLNGGLGDVILANRNTHLYGTNTAEKICVARHSNGCDFWVIGRNVGELNYRSYLINSSGFNTTAVLSTVSRPAYGAYIGSLKASPNSLMISDVQGTGGGGSGGIFVFNFNNTTGILSDKFSDNTIAAIQEYSSEFSPDNTKLYYTILQQPNIYQYDLTAASQAAFLASRQIIGAAVPANMGSYTTAALQLGPDKRIYVARNGMPNLGVINSPNLSGLACNYIDQSVNLGGKISVLGLPAITTSLIQDKVDLLNSKVCNGAANDYQFMLSNAANVLSVNWAFIPQANPSTTLTATGNPALVSFPAVGVYSVTALIAYNCYNDIVTSTVNITPMPGIDAGTSYSICIGASAGLTATVSPNTFNLKWQPALGLSSYTITNPVASPNVTTIYTVSSQAMVGSNLVTNGDFEISASGFSTQYIQSPSNQILAAPGYWSIGNTITNGWWANCSDHTPGSGVNMMFLDGADGVGSAVPINSSFWCQTINVQPNTDYAFSAWLTNANGSGATSQLLFSVNGNPLSAPINTPIGTCTWNQFSSIWNSGSNSTANICISEASGAQPGNDFAVDDISFYQLCTISDTVRVQVNPLPVITTNTAAICLGQQTATLTASGAQTYTWSTTATTSSISASPAATSQYTVTGTDANGCVNTATSSIVVNPTPTVTVNSATICVGQQTATLTALGAVSYSWSTSAATAIITQSPPVTTAYTVTGTDANACTNSVTTVILVNNLPAVTASSATICVGQQTVTLNAGGATTYTWSTAATTASISASPPATSQYTVTGTNANGCTNTATASIVVNALPLVTATASDICLGQQTATLTAGGAQTYSWSTTATTASIAQSPTVTTTYTVSGADGSGCMNTATTSITVYALPTASFTADSVCYMTNTHLLDASNGNGSPLTNYAWDFTMDGITDIFGVANPNYQFTNAGSTSVNYTVSSTPRAGLVCTNTITKNIWVHPNPLPDFNMVNKCINNQPNTFDATPSLIAVGTNTLYNWNYGDGASGTGLTSSHTYANAIVYTVTLTVTSDKGCTGTTTKQTEVYAKPKMSVSAGANVCLGQAMTFTAVSLPSGGIVTNWFWDFNNTISTIENNGQTVSYTFPATGTKTISLVSETDKGCRDTMSRQVYINYLPNPLFTVSNPAGCGIPKHCVTLKDTTRQITGPAKNKELTWVFGDGTSITANSGTSESHCYSNSSSSQVATYAVKLIVKTDSGCVNSLEKQNYITVYPTPLPAFQISADPGTIIEPFVQFINQSQNYTKWIWNFGDGTKTDATTINPGHVYGSEIANTYYPYLFVSNQYGCKDSVFVPVEIKPAFVFYIPNAFSPHNKDDVNDLFTGTGIGIDKYEMWIYDRWGTQVYHTNDITQGWNGKKKNSGDFVKQDVYVWKVTVKDVLGKTHDYVGHVTVL